MRVLPVLLWQRAELGGHSLIGEICSSCCCCQARRDVAGSGAAGEMLSAPEWMFPHKPCPEHGSKQQETAGLLWALAQVPWAASPGHFGCCWQSAYLPKHTPGFASGQGWKSQQSSQSVRAALSKLPWRLLDPLHGRKPGTPSLVGRPKELVTLVDFHTSPHFFCQARRVLAHITSWDQHAHCSGTREGLVASHTADAVLLSPCILFPKPRSQQLS